MIGEGIFFSANMGIIGVVAVLLVVYIAKGKKMDELTRRLLLVGFFLAVHELSYFLLNELIYELTKTLFFITLFYAFAFVINMHVQNTERIHETYKIKNGLDDMMELFYLRWPDYPLNTLNGMTPREAVKIDEKREEVKEILDEMEKKELKKKDEGRIYYDINKLRRALNLDSPIDLEI